MPVAWLDQIVNGGIRHEVNRCSRQIDTDDEEMNAFLFSLGCYSGEKITVISHIKGGCIVAIKDARYNFDQQLADAIIV